MVYGFWLHAYWVITVLSLAGLIIWLARNMRKVTITVKSIAYYTAFQTSMACLFYSMMPKLWPDFIDISSFQIQFAAISHMASVVTLMMFISFYDDTPGASLMRSFLIIISFAIGVFSFVKPEMAMNIVYLFGFFCTPVVLSTAWKFFGSDHPMAKFFITGWTIICCTCLVYLWSKTGLSPASVEEVGDAIFMYGSMFENLCIMAGFLYNHSLSFKEAQKIVHDVKADTQFLMDWVEATDEFEELEIKEVVRTMHRKVHRRNRIRSELPVFDLISLVASQTQPLSRQFQTVSISVAASRKIKGSTRINCDLDHIASAIFVFIQNGVEAARLNFGTPPSSMAVSCLFTIESNNLTVTISDTGKKIDHKDKVKIVTGLFPSTKGGSNEGIGIKRARDVILSHGGELEVVRHSQKTIFKLYIPLNVAA